MINPHQCGVSREARTRSDLLSTRHGALNAAVLALLVGITVGTLVHPYMAQQASRYALTASIVERGTVRLDAYEHVLGVDRAGWRGRLRPAQAPGQPLAALPRVRLGKPAGEEGATDRRLGPHPGPRG